MSLGILSRWGFIVFTALHANADFENYKNQHTTAYRSYKTSLDQDFAQHLKQEWASFKLFYPKSALDAPKIKTAPRLKPSSKPFVFKKTTPVKKQSFAPPMPSKPPKPRYGTSKGMRFDFYGNALRVPMASQMSQMPLKKLDKANISKAWLHLTKSNYKPTIKALKDHKKLLGLNDWGLYELTGAFAQKAMSSVAHATTLQWFLMIKMGFDVKLAYGKAGAYVLIASKQNIYAKRYVKLRGQKYYLPKHASLQTLNTYKASYGGKLKPLDFYFYQPLNLSPSYKKVKVGFTYFKQFHNFQATYNPVHNRFYNAMPQVDYTVYLHAAYPSASTRSLTKGLYEIVRHKDQAEALNMILRFVQVSKPYKTDQDQFGYEKVFFVPENWGNRYSDCEDRSLLFARLVKDILGLEVALVKYNGHLATGVKINTKGDKVRSKNRGKYLIADPTYINANIGETMPQYTGKTYKLIF